MFFFTRDLLVPRTRTGPGEGLRRPRGRRLPVPPAAVLQPPTSATAPGARRRAAEHQHGRRDAGHTESPASAGSSRDEARHVRRRAAQEASQEEETQQGGTRAMVEAVTTMRATDIAALTTMLRLRSRCPGARPREDDRILLDRPARPTQAGGHPDLDDSFALAIPGDPEAARNVDRSNARRGSSATRKRSSAAPRRLRPERMPGELAGGRDHDPRQLRRRPRLPARDGAGLRPRTRGTTRRRLRLHRADGQHPDRDPGLGADRQDYGLRFNVSEITQRPRWPTRSSTSGASRPTSPRPARFAERLSRRSPPAARARRRGCTRRPTRPRSRSGR